MSKLNIHDIWDYQKVMFIFFDNLLDKPGDKVIMDSLAGTDIDIRKLNVMNYAVIYDEDDTSLIHKVSVTFNDWRFEFRFIPSWTPAIRIEVIGYWKDGWESRVWSDVDFSANTISINHNYSDKTLCQLFTKGIRVRHRRTINEARKYLANQAMYDSIDALLTVPRSPRKKKK